MTLRQVLKTACATDGLIATRFFGALPKVLQNLPSGVVLTRRLQEALPSDAKARSGAEEKGLQMGSGIAA